MSDEIVKIAPLLQLRRDGRNGNQMRPQEIKKGHSSVTSADGGAWVSQGGTTVFASVTGPAAAKTTQEDYRKAVVVVTVQRSVASVPTRGGASRGTMEQRRSHQKALDASLSLLLSKTFANEVIDVQSYPRTCIAIDVVVVSDDGSLPAAVTNAAMCALLATGIKCRCTVGAICMTKLKMNWVGVDGLVNQSGGTEQLVWLDTSKGEELEAGPVVYSAPPTLVASSTAAALGSTREMWLQLGLQGLLGKVHQGGDAGGTVKKAGISSSTDASSNNTTYTEGQLAFLAKQKGILISAVDTFFVASNLSFLPSRIVASKIGTSTHFIAPPSTSYKHTPTTSTTTPSSGLTLEELVQLQNFALQATTKGVTEFTRLCVSVATVSEEEQFAAVAAAADKEESSSASSPQPVL